MNLPWGMPSPPTVTTGKPDYGVTNIRNLNSPHWRGWSGVKNRCSWPGPHSANTRTIRTRR
jgi:putative SOS response-associated peptidase YedK